MSKEWKVDEKKENNEKIYLEIMLNKLILISDNK